MHANIDDLTIFEVSIDSLEQIAELTDELQVWIQ